jgi:hypothetical protein
MFYIQYLSSGCYMSDVFKRNFTHWTFKYNIYPAVAIAILTSTSWLRFSSRISIGALTILIEVVHDFPQSLQSYSGIAL